MGGTAWAGSQTQYYMLENGQEVHIQNSPNVFGGVWWDDTNPIHDNVTGQELAQEAQRASPHGVTEQASSPAREPRLALRRAGVPGLPFRLGRLVRVLVGGKLDRTLERRLEVPLLDRDHPVDELLQPG